MSDNGTILMVDKIMALGGRQKILIELASGLQRICKRRVIIAAGEGPWISELDARGIKYEPIPGSNYGPIHQVRSAIVLNRLVRRYRASIIHSHCRYHNLTSLLAVNMLRAPAVRVTTAHNLFPDKHWSGFYPSNTICVSKAVEAYVKSVSRVSPNVILNGMPTIVPTRETKEVRHALEIGQDEVVLINVARLDEQKSQYFLLEAFHKLLQVPGLPPTRLVIVGEGLLRPRLENDIERFGISSNVLLLGECDDVANLLAASDIFVLSSRWEGLPITLIEAASAGLPLVSFDVGGVVEIVKDKNTGLLLSPGDVQGLSKALTDLVGNESRRRTMGDAAKVLYKSNFSIERCVEQTENYYQEVLSQTS